MPKKKRADVYLHRSQDIRAEQPYAGCEHVTPTVAQGHFALSAFSPLSPDVFEHKLRADVNYF